MESRVGSCNTEVSLIERERIEREQTTNKEAQKSKERQIKKKAQAQVKIKESSARKEGLRMAFPT